MKVSVLTKSYFNGYFRIVLLINSRENHRMTQAESTHELATRYSALVDYQPPPLSELETLFDYVYERYLETELQPIDACKGVSKEPREIAFELVHLSRFISTEEALGELKRLGFRPALHEEAIAVAPHLAKQHAATMSPQCAISVKTYPIAVLGSTHVQRHRVCSLYLYWTKDDEWTLCDYPIDAGWVSTVRFLVVRE